MGAARAALLALGCALGLACAKGTPIEGELQLVESNLPPTESDASAPDASSSFDAGDVPTAPGTGGSAGSGSGPPSTDLPAGGSGPVPDSADAAAPATDPTDGGSDAS